MRSSRALLSLPLLIVFAACGGGEAPAPEAAVTEAPAMAPAMPEAAPGMTATAAIQPVNGSFASGDVRVTGRGSETEVMVNLSGVQEYTAHNGHIHSGTCAAIGSVVQALQPVQANDAGSGMVTSTVPLDPAVVMGGGHIVVYHGADGPVACAEIPAS